MSDLRIGCIGAWMSIPFSGLLIHFGANLVHPVAALSVTAGVAFVGAVTVFGGKSA